MPFIFYGKGEKDLFASMTVIWLIVFAVMLVIEIITQGLTTIWFAGGALAALLSAFITDNIVIQAVIFVAVSIVLLVFTRPVAVKYFNKKVTPTNVEEIPGKTGIVTEEIDNHLEKGTVKLNGLEWTARKADPQAENIPVGAEVRVVKVEGVKLLVELI